jgi:hypothetical protein
MFFSEEKNQKTFMSGGCTSFSGHGRIGGGGGGTKVFCFFSSEKMDLPYC